MIREMLVVSRDPAQKSFISRAFFHILMCFLLPSYGMLALRIGQNAYRGNTNRADIRKVLFGALPSDVSAPADTVANQVHAQACMGPVASPVQPLNSNGLPSRNGMPPRARSGRSQRVAGGLPKSSGKRLAGSALGSSKGVKNMRRDSASVAERTAARQ